ncbi:hypothetical protein, partial [Streptomyces sp. KL109B]
VTYADLDYVPGNDSGEPAELDWLSVLRALREACVDKRQPDSMNASDFARFNQVLNLATRGGRPWTERMPSPDVDLGDPFDMDADRHAEARKAEIFQAFLTTLRIRAETRRRPHLLAIDNAQEIGEYDLDQVLLPLLFGAVQDFKGDYPVRILVVAPQSWPGYRHLQKFMAGSPVVLTEFQQPHYKRLAREFWERQRHANKVLRRLRFQDFEVLLDGINKLQGTPPSFPVGVYQQILDTWLSMADVDGMEEAG